jgi:hypothetical protein
MAEYTDTPIIKTPTGMVQPGGDFQGNRRPPESVKIEVGQYIQGNSPVSTPTPDAEIFVSNPETTD